MTSRWPGFRSGCSRRPSSRRHDADLRQPAGKLGGRPTCVGERRDAVRQRPDRASRVDAAPVHAAASTSAALEVVAERRAERGLVALLDAHAVDHRRQQVAGRAALQHAGQRRASVSMRAQRRLASAPPARARRPRRARRRVRGLARRSPFPRRLATACGGFAGASPALRCAAAVGRNCRRRNAGRVRARSSAILPSALERRRPRAGCAGADSGRARCGDACGQFGTAPLR